MCNPDCEFAVVVWNQLVRLRSEEDCASPHSVLSGIRLSLKWAVVGIFAPWRLANATLQGSPAGISENQLLNV